MKTDICAHRISSLEAGLILKMRTSTKNIETLRGAAVYLVLCVFLTVCNLFVFATGYSDLAEMNAYCISNVLNETHSAKAKIEIKKDLAMPYDFQFFKEKLNPIYSFDTLQSVSDVFLLEKIGSGLSLNSNGKAFDVAACSTLYSLFDGFDFVFLSGEMPPEEKAETIILSESLASSLCETKGVSSFDELVDQPVSLVSESKSETRKYSVVVSGVVSDDCVSDFATFAGKNLIFTTYSFSQYRLGEMSLYLLLDNNLSGLTSILRILLAATQSAKDFDFIVYDSLEDDTKGAIANGFHQNQVFVDRFASIPAFLFAVFYVATIVVTLIFILAFFIKYGRRWSNLITISTAICFSLFCVWMLLNPSLSICGANVVLKNYAGVTFLFVYFALVGLFSIFGHKLGSLMFYIKERKLRI